MAIDLKSARLSNKGVSLSREQKFLARFNMYNDNYKSQVINRLEEIYSKSSLIGLDKQLDMTNNLYKTIVEKISRVYNSGVNRSIEDENLLEMYTKSRITKTMKYANRYLNAFNDLILQVSWNDVTNEPRLIFRYPHKTRVELDEFDKPISVEYFVEHVNDNRERWAFWSNEEHYYKVYDAKQDFIVESINDENTNPYSVLPFVFMQNGFRDGTFFDEFSGDDLIEGTLDTSVYNTFKNYLIKWQSFKQLVVQGSNVGEIQGQMLDPASALTASGNDISFQLLDLQANLEQLQNVLDQSVNKIATNYNISPNQFRMSGQVSSGFALKMENQQLDEYTVEQQQDFIEYERELHKLLVLIGNAHGNNFKDEDINITFDPITYSESRSEALDAAAKAIELGLKSPVEVLMIEKDISEEEAKKLVAKNIQDRNELYKKVDTTGVLNQSETRAKLGL